VSTADFEELLAILDLNRLDDDMFVGSHPSKNPVRTFGGQMMAQAFVAGSRTVLEKLRPSALSVHFIAGGDPEKDLEFHVVRLRDERRFANRRVDVMQNGELLTTAMISYMNGGRGIEHGIEPPELADPESVPSVGLGLGYIAVFGAGSILGMALLSVAMAVPLKMSASYVDRVHRAMSALVGIFSTLLGGYMVWEIGYLKTLLAG